MKRWCALMTVVLLSMLRGVLWASDDCAVCGLPIQDTIYIWEDEVADVKRRLCSKCIVLPKSCFMCSMPVLRNYTELPDGRVLCARDAKTAVINEDEALRICDETKETMSRLFSRFVSFPETNLTISLADRVSLIALFRIPGRDYQCPNLLGYIETKTNKNRVTHDISLMAGLRRVTLKSTFAHEYTHAWVAENVSPTRREELVRDAEEGFCELVSYMVMDSLGDEEGKKAIKLNAYTRGQFGLFLEAERRFGFNEVADWMKYGVDDSLREDNLARVRDVDLPVATRLPQTNTVATAVPVRRVELPPPQALMLKGITWSARPMALINDQNFETLKQNKVRVGTNTVTIRCLAIREDSVLIQNVDTGEKLELKLKSR